MKKPALLLSLLALGALGLTACDGDEAPKRSDEEKIAKTGNAWASLFAAGADNAACRYEGQPACEQIRCKHFSQPIEGCTPPPSAYRKSFADATVEDVAISGENAGAKFSNGETAWFNGGQHEPGTREWYVSEIGGNAGKEYFTEEMIVKAGNAWARLFAKADLHNCGYMVQPACEREDCKGVGGLKIENCTPPSSAYRKSFEGATVEHVAIQGNRAGAEFSNGEVVKFGRVDLDLSGVPDRPEWRIARWEGDAGTEYFEPEFTGPQRKAYNDARNTCAREGVEGVASKLDFGNAEPTPEDVASGYGTKLWPPPFKQAVSEGCLAGFSK